MEKNSNSGYYYRNIYIYKYHVERVVYDNVFSTGKRLKYRIILCVFTLGTHHYFIESVQFFCFFY